MAYYLGIDNGGTTTKASIYDSTGREMATSSTSTDIIVPEIGFTERNMDEMWDANCKVIREVLKKSRIDPKEIACVACCGHGKGLYLWGKDGKPVRNGIVSTDNRAWEYPIKWKRSGIEEKVFQISCQHILASQPVSLLAWLRDNEPDAIEKTQWIFECKDYVRFRLSGETKAELTDYSGANFINLHTGAYDIELLKLFGLEDCADKLPPLCRSFDICGYVTAEAAEETGLAEGTMIAGGAFDIDACALAVDITSEDNICMIAGTWSINEYIRKTPVLDGSVMMNSFFSIPGYYLVEECSPTSAGNNEWFINTLMPEVIQEQKRSGRSVYDFVNKLVESIPDEELCPIFLPFLMASNVHPNAQGSFVGVSKIHTRAHIARSIYEGIAFSHRYHLEKLLATKTAAPSAIRLAGGVVNSAVWTQMFADVMGIPVECVSVSETGTLGCAIIGAAAAGEYENVAEAASKMCTIRDKVYPIEENREIYEKKYQLYIDTINCLDPVWDKFEQYRTGVADRKIGRRI